MNRDRVAELVRELLVEIGEDPDREALLRTPARVAESLEFLPSGYRTTVAEVLGGAVFEAEAESMVVVRDIEVHSLCEHHILPFFGRCHIGYIPRAKMLGVSKLAALVECFARRLQVQERLTEQVARAVMDGAEAHGVGVVMECRHLCMTMRGVREHNATVTTSSMLGSFHDHPEHGQEFLALIGRPGA